MKNFIGICVIIVITLITIFYDKIPKKLSVKERLKKRFLKRVGDCKDAKEFFEEMYKNSGLLEPKTVIESKTLTKEELKLKWGDFGLRNCSITEPKPDSNWDD